MNKILFTSIGRRVQLIRHFVERGWRVVGTDLSPESCAAQVIAHQLHRVPPSAHPQYVEMLLEICMKEKVEYLVPLYEPELIRLAQLRDQFLAIGTRLIVSSVHALQHCLDKYELYQVLCSAEIPTPETYISLSMEMDPASKWVVKPRTGMGSKDVHVVTYAEVASTAANVNNPLIQRFIEGQEYSIDAYVAEDGQVLSIVPRLRMEVRSGEVSKSITVTDKDLTLQTIELLNHLQLFGPVTIQGIKEAATGEFYFIEVNPRFGGGVPLSMQAGIPYADFIAGKHDLQSDTLYPYQSGLKMLRYDEAVFVTERG
jgi:carbamoyl-phosphate synthase large subunit